MRPRDDHSVPSVEPGITESTEATAANPPKRKRQLERSRSSVAYPRKRAVAACKPCRAKKVKCDNARPQCGACVGTSPSACSYDDGDNNLSSFDPASIAILERLGQVLDHVKHLGQPGPTPGSFRDSPGRIPEDAAGPQAFGLGLPQSSSPSATTTSHSQVPAAGEGDSATKGRVAADTILAWPIFASVHRHSPTCLIDGVYEAELETHDAANQELLDTRQNLPTSNPRFGGFDEGEVPRLVQQFLQHVHVKNPILDPDTLVSLGQQVTETGIAWDAASCLILIVCALGCVAGDFAEPQAPGAAGADTALPGNSLGLARDDIARADSYLNLARRRLSLVDAGLMGMQCHYLAGVYLMYTMRPLQAWGQIDAATRRLLMYLKCQTRRASSTERPRRLRSLEQRLYWSCLKSQVELQLDFDLPPGSLASLEYPDLFPMPPDLISDGHTPPGNDQSRDDGSLQRNEAAWYYYLTEITLRRFSDRVLQAFYKEGFGAWTAERMGSMIKVAKELDEQLDDYLRCLPEVLRRQDESGVTSGELAFCTRGLFNDQRSLIHRPFLYYVVHNPPTAPHWTTAETLAIKAFPSAGAAWHGRHRHHGAWFGVGWMFSLSVMVLAALRSTHYVLPPDRDWLGLVHKCRRDMLFWAEELPAISRACEVIDDYLQDLSG